MIGVLSLGGEDIISSAFALSLINNTKNIPESQGSVGNTYPNITTTKSSQFQASLKYA